MMHSINMREIYTVLLVDDQKIVAVALQKMLAELPEVRLEVCSNGSEALEMAERLAPALIMQDLMLPEISGLELLTLYKNSVILQRTPVMILSTTEDAAVKSEAFSWGATDYVVKFPEPIELRARVRYHARAYLDACAREEALKAFSQTKRLQSLGTMASGIAHEMNSPLQYLLSNLEYIAQVVAEGKSQESEVNDALYDCINGAKKISSIIHAMRGLCPEQSTHLSTIPVTSVITTARTLTEHSLHEVAEVLWECPTSLDNIIGVESDLSQALVALLFNARDTLRKKRTEVPTFRGKISVEAKLLESSVVISISDNGEGMSKEMQERACEPFVTTKSFGNGIGCGLSQVYQTVVTQCGGKLDFTSEVGKGTTVTLSLPIAAEKT